MIGFSAVSFVQCCVAVGWVSGRSSGLKIRAPAQIYAVAVNASKLIRISKM